MDILQDRLKCLSFIISRLNLTWSDTLIALVPRLGLHCPSTSTGSSFSHLNLTWSDALIALVPRLGLHVAISTSPGQTH